MVGRWFALFLSLASGAWVEILPSPLNYCPQSPLFYNCSQYQQEVWNAPSLAISSKQVRSTNPICVVYLPGTGGNAYQYIKGLLSSISLLDLHLISLSYLSTSYSVLDMNRLCGDINYNNNVDMTTCINQLHATVVFGSESSTIWQIHPSDSISHRLLLTLQSLGHLDPSWKEFFSPSKTHEPSSVRWDRIIIAGHSQGAGHAGYIAATQLTYGAVLLSGIQDCCSYSTYMNSNISPWVTPSTRLSILFHSYEDLKGLIVANTDQYLPGLSPIEYTSASSTPLQQSQYFYVKDPVQNSSSCQSSSRPEHSSTATDTCSPLDPWTQPTGYLYQRIWQHLISRIRTPEEFF
jgi:hypothetical protein